MAEDTDSCSGQIAHDLNGGVMADKNGGTPPEHTSRFFRMRGKTEGEHMAAASVVCIRKNPLQQFVYTGRTLRACFGTLRVGQR